MAFIFYDCYRVSERQKFPTISGYIKLREQVLLCSEKVLARFEVRHHSKFDYWYHYTKEDYIMSVRKDDLNLSFEFVDLRLTEGDKESFNKFLKTPQADLDAMTLDLLAEGYKISFSYDQRHDCVICSITGTKEAKYNSGLILTSRAADYNEALALGLYKHFVIFNRSKWKSTDKDSNRWG